METYILSPEDWEKLIAALEAPPNPSEALIKLMRSKASWES